MRIQFTCPRCGDVIYVIPSHITRYKSCGKKCRYLGVKRETISVIGPSIAYIPLTKGMYALVDSEDAERLGKYNWQALPQRPSGHYATRCDGKRFSYMHREIAGIPDGMVTDHKNQEKLHNFKGNLRAATESENRMNTPPRKGLKGTFQIPSGMWQASIGKDGNQLYLGVYGTPEEAHAVYLAKAHELYGEFARG